MVRARGAKVGRDMQLKVIIDGAGTCATEMIRFKETSRFNQVLRTKCLVPHVCESPIF